MSHNHTIQREDIVNRYKAVRTIAFSSEPRISQAGTRKEGGTSPKDGSTPTNYLANFYRKLHVIKKTWLGVHPAPLNRQCFYLYFPVFFLLDGLTCFLTQDAPESLFIWFPKVQGMQVDRTVAVPL